MTEKLIEYVLYYLSTNWIIMLKKTFIAAIIFIFIYILLKRIINKVQKRIEENNLQSDSNYSKKLSGLVWKVLFILGMIFNILIIFQIIWIDVALLMAWVSLWIWFAMETMISNMVAWFFILTNKKIKIWDFVQLLWQFDINGTIEEISMRHTVIRTIDKRRLLIPNILMASTPIKTLKSEKLIRWDIELDLPRYINPKQIKDIINSTINESPNVLHKNYTNTFIKSFDAKWYKFQSVFFINPENWLLFGVSSKIRTEIDNKLKKYGIKYPYEHIVVNVE
jgi:small-conductance mechanosensitive channel